MPNETLSGLPRLLLLLKATTKKKVWIPQFTKKNGQVIGGHYAMVHVSDDHSHEKVAGGQGSYSQKKAHAQLAKEGDAFHGLPVHDKAALVMHHATQIQDGDSMKARLSTLKAKIAKGEKPLGSEWKAFHAAPPDLKEQVMDTVKAAGKVAEFDHQYAAWHAANPEVNGAPASEEPESTAVAKPAPPPEIKESSLKSLHNLYQKAEKVAASGDIAELQKMQSSLTHLLPSLIPEAQAAGQALLKYLKDAIEYVGQKAAPVPKSEENSSKRALAGTSGQQPGTKPAEEKKSADITAGEPVETAAEQKVREAKRPAGADPLAMPDFQEGKEAKGVKAYYEKIAQKIISHAKAGDVGALSAMLNPSKGNTWKGKTANSKMILALHDAALQVAKGEKSAAHTDKAPGDTVAESKPSIDASKLPEPMKGKVNPAYGKQAKELALAGDVAGLTALVQEVAPKILPGTVSYILQLKMAVEDQQQNAAAPAKADDGPKEGDTKPGADGELTFKDGRWHKQEQAISAMEKLMDDVGAAGSSIKAQKLAWAYITAADGAQWAIDEAVGVLNAAGYGVNAEQFKDKSHAVVADDAKLKLKAAIAGAKVPSENTNAKSFNPKVDAIMAALEAGNTKALLSMKFGINTYGKKAEKLKQQALAFLGAAPDQKEAEKPRLKVVSVKENKPVEAAAPTVPAPPKLKEFNNDLLVKEWQKLAKDPAQHDKLVTSIQMLADTLSKNPVMQKDPEYLEIAKYGTTLLQSIKAKKDAQSAAAEPAPAAPAGIPEPTGEIKEVHKLVFSMLKQAAEAGDVATIKQYMADVENLIPDAAGHVPYQYAQKLLVHLEGKPAVASTAGLTEAELPPSPKFHSPSNAALVKEAEELAKNGNMAALLAHIKDVKDKKGSVGKLVNYLNDLNAALAKKQGVAYQHVPNQWDPDGDIDHNQEGSAAPPEVGPKDGDTKQGADGMLVFKNGRWHKQGETEASKPVLSEDEINAIKPGGANATFAAKISKLCQEGDIGGLEYMLKVELKGYKKLPATRKFLKAAIAALKAKQPSTGKKKVASKAASSNPQSAASTSAHEPAKNSGTGEVKHVHVSDVMNGGIQSIDSWKKTGDQKGSNKGGFYTDPDGQQWYVKTPQSDDHVKNELLANKLYEALGIKVPEVKQVKVGGKLSIASKVIDGLKKDPAALAASPDMAAGFAADAWLGNWDVAGLEFDNAMVDKSGGVHRIDPGGALLYRAQGTPKGDAFGNAVTEFDTLRDPTKNSQSAAVFANLTPEQIEESVKNVLLLKDSAIIKLCKAYGPGTKEEREALADKLIARKKDIAAKFPEVAAEVAPKKMVQIAPAPNFLEWKGPGQGLSSKKHINEQNQALAEQMQKLAADGELSELENMKFQPISYEDGAPIGAPQPISQHKSKHIPMYWNDLISAIKNPIRSVEHMKDAVVETVGGVFGTLVSLFDDVKSLKEAAAKVGRYALIGAVDGDPFESWGIKELSQKNGGINAADLYDASHKAYNELSKIEKTAIKEYTGSGYSTMNNAATGVGSHGNTDYAIAGIDKASAPLKAGTVLSRKFSFKTDEDMQKFLNSEGGIVKDFGIISTSLNPGVWSGNVHLRIVCGEGVKGCYVAPNPKGGGDAISQHPGEAEVILPYGTRFFVRKVHKQGHKFTDEHGAWGNGPKYVVEVVALPNS